MTFIEISELKSQLNVKSLDLGWSHRGKLVLRNDAAGISLKCQQDLDPSKPLAFMYNEAEGQQLHDGCLVNVDRTFKPLVEVVAVL